ncbi:MAG: EFR1 family ferrodoxin [Clostridiales bacterium]|jgi:ferredoxin|nr:EFR1 family ferrodoxin [Clostridiales bacterium]
MTIFYFTGTGNSLFAARKIADATNASLISIPQAIAERRAYADGAIGFVYPQYAVGLPKMVRRFILENAFEADYLFAVDLYAFIRLNALGEIAALMPLDYGAYLKTPWNFISMFSPPKDPGAVLAKAENKLGQIIDDVKNRRSKPIRPRNNIGNATKHFGVSQFKVTADCTKCGVCVNVCPANNIRLNGGIVFDSNCETCFACANLCPAHAIYSNKAMLKRRQYRNPAVSADEIAKANICNKNYGG